MTNGRDMINIGEKRLNLHDFLFWIHNLLQRLNTIITGRLTLFTNS
jgi:hypothetical protein